MLANGRRLQGGMCMSDVDVWVVNTEMNRIEVLGTRILDAE